MVEKNADKAAGRSAEKLTEAATEGAAALQEYNARLARSFFEGSIEALEAQAELERHTVQSMAELAREHQEAFRELSRRSLDAYDGFLNSVFSYYKEVSGEPEETGDRR